MNELRTVDRSEISTPSERKSPYRGDIDGLRCISVVSVILFHMSPLHFPAGGIGVDIFFVISGYLIGGIILSGMESGRFSFADFYLRRLRRIAPAFLVMVIVSSAAAALLLYPSALKGFADSALAALGSVANVYFNMTSGYFDPDSAELPLLHTWTLGVEEQFYVIFPILAMVVFRLKAARHVAALLIGLALVSLAVSQYQVASQVPAAFYLLPSRGWELVLGVLATRTPPRLFQSMPLRLAVAVLGLVLIAGSLALLDPAHGFPGFAAVPPCLGAALLLASGKDGATVAHRALSLFPLRIVGLASYSLYLWHWPILVLTKLYLVNERPPLPVYLAMTAAIFAAGFASWQFVERPSRSPSLPPRRLILWCAGLAVAVIAIQAIFLISRGLPNRFSPQELKLAEFSASGSIIEPPHTCFLHKTDVTAHFDARNCLAVVAGKPNWLLIGDSHAGMFYHGLQRSFPGINLQSAVIYGCDVDIGAPAGRMACNGLMHEIFADYLPSAKIAGVIFTMIPNTERPSAIAALGHSLKARGLQLLVIGPTPGYAFPAGRILAEAQRRRDPSLKLQGPAVWDMDRQLREAARGGDFEYVSPLSAMCPHRNDCLLQNARGEPIYFDGNHYTPEGSMIVIQRLLAQDAANGRALAHTLLKPSPNPDRMGP